MADCRLMLNFNGADAATATHDETGRHPVITFNGTAQLSTTDVKMGLSNLLLDGGSDFLTIPNSEDWNIVAVASESWTVDFFTKHVDHAGTEVYASQTVDANNYWRLSHSDGSGLRFHVNVNGVVIIDTGSGGEIADLLWHHVALCVVADEIGIYLDRQQVCYVQDSSAATIAASLFVGQSGYASGYLNGRMDRLRIDKSNHFGAAPNAGLTDTIAVLNPLAHWRLDDNVATAIALDSSGNGFDAAISGGNNSEDLSVPGWIDDCFKFDGSVDAIVDTDVFWDTFFDGGVPWSVSFWCYCVTNATYFFIRKESGSEGFHIKYRADLDRWQVSLWDGINDQLRAHADTDPTGSLVHVVVTYNGATDLNLYIDAVLATITTNNGSPDIGTTNDLGIAETGFDGKMDDVLVFARVLTATEVTAINTAGLAGRTGATEEYEAWELMPVFPTLSVAPEGEGWTEDFDPRAVRASAYESGYQVRESRHTFGGTIFTHRRSWMPEADKIALRAFYSAYKDRVFLWVNDHDRLTYQVVFEGPPSAAGSSSPTPWAMHTTLRQVHSQVIS